MDGLRAWALHDDGGDLHATWVPDAGMLGASLIHQGEELLWQGAGAGEYAKARAFMGIGCGPSNGTAPASASFAT